MTTPPADELPYLADSTALFETIADRLGLFFSIADCIMRPVALRQFLQRTIRALVRAAISPKYTVTGSSSRAATLFRTSVTF